MVPESVVVPTAAPTQQPEDRHGPGVSSSARRVDHSPLRLEALRAWSAVTTVHHPRGPASQSLMMVLVDKWRCQDWAGVSLPNFEGARHVAPNDNALNRAHPHATSVRHCGRVCVHARIFSSADD
jgi:hypothetical protein